MLPLLAGMISAADSQAFRYLGESVENFPSPTELANQIRAAGFRNVLVRSMTLKIVRIHTANRE